MSKVGFNIFFFGQAFQHKGVGGNHLDRSSILPMYNYCIHSILATISDTITDIKSFFRIDIFVLLDLIGAGDMSFMKLESSTG